MQLGKCWVACVVVLLLGNGALYARVGTGDDAQSPVITRGVIHENRDYRLLVEAGMRWQQGTARELVYAGPFLLSDLTWDIKDLLYAGLTLRMRLGESWGIEASHWEAISEGRGGMTNYDFFIPFLWTDFSDGDVDINRAYILDVHGSWIFLQRAQTRLQLLAGYRELYWDWSQYGGDFIYSENGFRDSIGSFPSEQNGINYEQKFQIPYAGIGFHSHWRTLSLGAYLQYSPFARARGWDEHVLRNLLFEDTFRDVAYYAAGLSATYPLGDRWSVSGAWDWHNIPVTRGDVRIIDMLDGSEERVDNAAGIANEAWSFSISAGMHF